MTDPTVVIPVVMQVVVKMTLEDTPIYIKRYPEEITLVDLNFVKILKQHNGSIQIFNDLFIRYNSFHLNYNNAFF